MSCSDQTTDNNEKTIKSKYFSIDSYFSLAKTNKRLKADSDNFTTTNDPAAAAASAGGGLSKKEQCPICQTFILTESVSFEVHVNLCLDQQQQQQQQEQKQAISLPIQEQSLEKTKHNVQEQSTEETDQIPECTVAEFIPTQTTIGSFANLVERFSSSNGPIVQTFPKEQPQGLGIEENNTSITAGSTASVDCTSPRSWKSAFAFSASGSSPTRTVATVLQPIDTNVSHNILPNRYTTTNKKKKTIPFYKWVKDTRFVVDAFNYGRIPNCDGYFLSHYHSDHFGGLTSKWSHGPIYCSKVTANLVKQELRVDPRYIHPLPINELYPLPTTTTSTTLKLQGTSDAQVEVALIDANHCPGSVLFLFVINKKIRHLHTGDFRASPKMCLHPLLRQPENPPIGNLYLDTTYLNPKYAFPAQEECIQAVCNAVSAEINGTATVEKISRAPSLLDKWVKQPLLTKINDNFGLQKVDSTKEQAGLMINKDAFELMMSRSRPKKSTILFVVGTYTIGKERVFINIARLLKCKIYAPSKKKRILLCQDDGELESMLTNDPTEAQVHVVSLRDIKADTMYAYLHQYQSNFDRLVAFKPTGWTFRSTETQTLDMKLAPLCEIILPPADRSLTLSPQYSSKKDSGKVKIYGVPYSEHSSFRELASFIASLDIKNIIPTVNNHDVNSMRIYLDRWQDEKRAKRIEVVAYPNEDHW